MRFILKPSVYLISRPNIDRGEIEKFLADNGFDPRFAWDHTRPAEQLSATASRTCYQSFDNGRPPDDHIKHLVSIGHGSVFAHANFSVLAAGISRSLTHELIRHHVGTGVSQLSQRFVTGDSHLNFVVPPLLAAEWANPEYRSDTLDYVVECRKTVESYRRWLAFWKDKGVPHKKAAETARSKLTNDVETRCVFTGNVRAWRNIWEQRCTSDADAEIRRFACATYNLISPHIPTICADYIKVQYLDGTFILHTEHKKI